MSANHIIQDLMCENSVENVPTKVTTKKIVILAYKRHLSPRI